MTFPVFDLTRAPPGRMTLPYIAGGGLEGGRSLSGIVSVLDLSGGGLVAVKYSNISLGNVDSRNLRYWSQLSAQLGSGVRSIIVPLLTDFMAPVYVGTVLQLPLTFSDGSLFSDGTGFKQPNGSTPGVLNPGDITAVSVGAAALNAGTIVIKMQNGSELLGGEWFSIEHPTKFSRAYCITDIDAVVPATDGSAGTFTVGIRPPLREAVADGTAINFVRPRCLMRVDAAASLTAELSDWWWTTPEIAFVESFGST